MAEKEKKNSRRRTPAGENVSRQQDQVLSGVQNAPKIGKIAGCYVLDGIVKSGTNARVIRDGVIIYDGHIASIQREKDVVKEVKKGFECGITLENFSDIKEGDIIEDYEMVEIKR